MNAAEHTFCFLTAVAESLSLCLQPGAAGQGTPPALAPSVWLTRSDLSDSRNTSADFIRSGFPANPSMCLFGALGAFSVAYGNVLPPIIVHLVPWYHRAPPPHFPLICIQMTFLSGCLHRSSVMKAAALIYIIQLKFEEYKWRKTSGTLYEHHMVISDSNASPTSH